MRRSAVALAGMIALGGCAPATTARTGRTTTTRTAMPGSTAAATLPPPRACRSGTVDTRVASSYQVIRPLCLHVGARLELDLVGSPGFYGPRWSPPTSSAPAVLARVSYVPRRQYGYLATFSAGMPGVARVEATGEPGCRSIRPPCEIVDESLVVVVEVR